MNAKRGKYSKRKKINKYSKLQEQNLYAQDSFGNIA